MSMNWERYTGTIDGRASDLAIECTTACQPAVVNPTPVIVDASESVMGNAHVAGMDSRLMQITFSPVGAPHDLGWQYYFTARCRGARAVRRIRGRLD